MKNTSKMLLAMGASALAGAAAGYYLNSDKGRKTRRKAVKQIRKTANEASDRINEMADTAKTTIGRFAGQAEHYMGQITQSADEVLEAASDTLEKGKKAARARMSAMASNGVK
ncbi:MAG: hypothetical protein EP344_12680 [Bacteroidetes bacterium]|nr:MAG: hypothetical protein EP344_12680 [Bacteroidota bacterium]